MPVFSLPHAQVGVFTNLLDTTIGMQVCSWLPVGENTDRGRVAGQVMFVKSGERVPFQTGLNTGTTSHSASSGTLKVLPITTSD